MCRRLLHIYGLGARAARRLRRATGGPENALGGAKGGPKRGRQDMQRPLHISASGRRAPQGARKARKVRKVREMRKEREESEEGDGSARGQ